MHKFRFLLSDTTFTSGSTATAPPSCSHFVIGTAHGSNADFNHAHITVNNVEMAVPAGQFVAISQIVSGSVITAGENCEIISFYGIEY